MLRGAVFYKGVWLARNSKCMELYEAQRFVELDKLMKELAETYRKQHYG